MRGRRTHNRDCEPRLLPDETVMEEGVLVGTGEEEVDIGPRTREHFKTTTK